MAIPGSGQVSISDLATEFGDSAPNQMSEFYRGGSLVPNTPGNSSVPTSGQISLSNFYGAQNRSVIALNLTSDSASSYNVYSNAAPSPSYSAGATDVTVTVSPGVRRGSPATGASYAITVPSQFTSGDTVTIVNQGQIVGRAGNGGAGGTGSGSGGAGGVGGRGILLQFPTTIDNNSVLAGGGGGGGGGGGARRGSPNPKGPIVYQNITGGGGGGGGGYPAGSGGSPNGSSGQASSQMAGGGGGTGQSQSQPNPKGTQTIKAGNGGPGGARGVSGTSGQAGTGGGSGGGGGQRGYYLVGNPYVTWQSTGTRTGLLS